MCSVLTGDETGLLKYVVGKEFYRYGDQQSREKGVIGMISIIKSSTSQSNDDIIVVLRKNSTVEAWKKHHGDHHLHQYDSIMVDVKNPTGILKLHTSSDSFNNVMIYGDDGSISILHVTPSGIESCNMSKYRPDSGLSLGLTQQDDDEDQHHHNVINIKGPISAGASCSNGVAFGGNENDLMLYDVNTMTMTWQAKNVPHDKLRLRVPIWITAVDFLKPLECDVSTGAKIVTGTGYKHVRIYDTRVSCQPVTSIDVSEDYRVTAIRPTHDGLNLYVGDTAGGFHLWDLRTNRRKNTLKGFAGSIRDIQLDHSGHHVAAVSLDRFMRLYNITSTNHELQTSCYLKNKLTCCLMIDDENGDDQHEDKTKIDDDDDDQHDDDLIEEYEDSDDDDDGDKVEDDDDDTNEDEEEEVDEDISFKRKSSSSSSQIKQQHHHQTKPNNHQHAKKIQHHQSKKTRR